MSHNHGGSYLNARMGNAGKSSQKSSGSSTFLDVSSELADIRNERMSLLENAANHIARYMITMNKRGETDAKKMHTELIKLLEGYTTEDQLAIYRMAIPIMVANL